MAKIYYADDEEDIREVVGSFLRSEGHEVETFETGDLLLETFQQNPCDLVLLDIMMPGTDGIGILQKIRKSSSGPVILLTARDTDMDLYNGLALGSDDYLVKPFKPLVLSARINALLRRVRFDNTARGEKKEESEDLACGNLHYSRVRHEVTVGKTPVPLTPTEMKFLEYMMLHFEEAVPKDTLLDTIWGMNSEIESRVADETSRRLRKKLTAAGADVYIQTVWGYGFKLTNVQGA